MKSSCAFLFYTKEIEKMLNAEDIQEIREIVKDVMAEVLAAQADNKEEPPAVQDFNKKALKEKIMSVSDRKERQRLINENMELFQ